MNKRFRWHVPCACALALACACALAHARDGDLDKGFGTNGITIVDFGTTANAESLAIAPDGSLVLGGHVYNSTTHRDVAVARLRADGTLDPTFADNGSLVVPSMGGSDEYALATLVLADGRIVLTGYANIGGNYDMLVMRLNADGSPDTSFGGSGSVVVPFDLGGSNVDIAKAVIEDADGKLVIAGYAYVNDGLDQQNDVAVARLNTDGSLDTSFDGDGKTTFRFDADFFAYFDNDYGTSLALDDAGSILVGGYVQNGHTADDDFAVARLLPSGAIDTSFGVEGRARIDFALGGRYDEAMRVLVAPDGAIYLVGMAAPSNSDSDMAVARLTPQGMLDSTWGDGGKATIAMPTDDDDSAQANAAVLQADGKLLLAGTVRNGGGNFRFAFARLDASGQIDASFGDGGTRAYGLGSAPNQWNEVVSDLRLDATGHAVFAGYSYAQRGFMAGRLVIDTIFDDGFGP